MTPRQTNTAIRNLSLAVAAGLATVLVASLPAGAANFGFRQQPEVSSATSAGLYWLSLPYRYTPPDFNSNLQVDAEDLAQDLQPFDLARPCSADPPTCAVVRVWRWDPLTGEYATWTSGSAGTPFELEPGSAYGVEVQGVEGRTLHYLDLVGAHDPSLEHSDCHTPGGVNMRWVSIPPHLKIDTAFGIPGVLDAEDLGQAMGGPEHVFQVRRLDEVTGVYDNWVVGSSYGTPFQVRLDRGYAVDLSCADLAAPCEDCPWTWAPAHY